MTAATYKYPPNLDLPLILGEEYVTNLGKIVKVTYISPTGATETCLNGRYYMTADVSSGGDFYGHYERIIEGPLAK